jgi:hypothetical protein
VKEALEGEVARLRAAQDALHGEVEELHESIHQRRLSRESATPSQ